MMCVLAAVGTRVTHAQMGGTGRAVENATYTVFADEQIEITHTPGTSGDAVVSFAGVGMGLGGVQVEEFRKSLAGIPNDLFFVKDKSRTWYNDSFPTITKILNEVLDRLLIRNTITIGNSMGGFGAIIFAAKLRNCTRAIAFAAQSSVDPEVVSWEQRYNQWFRNISKWAGLDATRLLDSKIQYDLLFGDGDPLDVLHAERLAAVQSPRMVICIVDGSGHDIAEFLKRRNLLRPLVDALVVRDEPCQEWMKQLREVPHRLLADANGTCWRRS
jgi:pimeloyl-ACP methyl ester carboxylesterase